MQTFSMSKLRTEYRVLNLPECSKFRSDFRVLNLPAQKSSLDVMVQKNTFFFLLYSRQIFTHWLCQKALTNYHINNEKSLSLSSASLNITVESPSHFFRAIISSSLAWKKRINSINSCTIVVRKTKIKQIKTKTKKGKTKINHK